MVDGADFSFETLSKQEAVERKQPRLTKLDPGFWDALESYLRSLGENLRREQERNPSSRKIALLQDELRNATRKSESLWEAREKKIAMQALKDSRTEATLPLENALRFEQALHNELVTSFRRFVPPIVHALEKSSEAPTVSPVTVPPASPTPRAPAPALAPVAPSAPPPSAPAPAASKGNADDAVTVRALVDVPPFVGLDGRTYRLRKGDVLTLPRKMVDLLAKRGQVAVMA